MEPIPEKLELRKKLLALRLQIFDNIEVKSSLELQIRAQLETLLEQLRSQHNDTFEDRMASYLPFGTELDINGIFADKRWFPKINNNSLLWFLAGFEDLRLLPKGAKGIREQVLEKCQDSTATRQTPWIVFVPALCADHEGFRLGYGGGYYDRFLSTHDKHIVSVVCLPEEFVFQRIPRENHDFRVDFLVTEKGIRSFTN